MEHLWVYGVLGFTLIMIPVGIGSWIWWNFFQPENGD